jgi:hypothetical protein
VSTYGRIEVTAEEYGLRDRRLAHLPTAKATGATGTRIYSIYSLPSQDFTHRLGDDCEIAVDIFSLALALWAYALEGIRRIWAD